MAHANDVLILDDQQDSADMLAAVLQMHFPEATFRVVYTGEKAVQAAAERLPELAIFDLEMLGLGGEAAARTIRETPGGDSVVFIALSGNVLKVRALLPSRPFDHGLSKPLNIDEIVSLVSAEIHREP